MTNESVADDIVKIIVEEKQKAWNEAVDNVLELIEKLRDELNEMKFNDPH